MLVKNAKRSKATKEDVQLGRIINRTRVLKGIKITEVAEKLGLSSQQVHKYEEGVNRVSAVALSKIAKILKVSLFDLYSEIADDESHEGPKSLPSKPSKRATRVMDLYHKCNVQAQEAMHLMLKAIVLNQKQELK